MENRYLSGIGRVDLRIEEEIFGKRSELLRYKGNPAFAKAMKKQESKNLDSIGDCWAFLVENPDMRTRFYQGEIDEETVKREGEKGKAAARKAWDYLSRIAPTGSLIVNSLTPNVLKELNKIVLGREANAEHNFRNFDIVSGSSLNYSPPSYKSIEHLVKNFISRIPEIYKRNPLVAGIYSHFTLFCIRPFDDGNKKVARLIGDRILSDAGMTPAIIAGGEGNFYYKLFCDAANACGEESASNVDNRGWREKVDLFFDYIASKVNNSLDEALKDLQKNNFFNKF